jgi:hypothetical protein
MAQKENHSAAQHSGAQQQMPHTATSHTACTASIAPQKQDLKTALPLTGLLWYVGQRHLPANQLWGPVNHHSS